VVSHDRYFMDKVVDHLLVFKGEGEIQDFPGNYTQFRDFQKMKSKEEEQQKPTKNSSPTANEQKKDYRNNYQSRVLLQVVVSLPLIVQSYQKAVRIPASPWKTSYTLYCYDNPSSVRLLLELRWLELAELA